VVFCQSGNREGAEGVTEVANAFAVPVTNATLGDQAALSVQNAISKGGEFAKDYGPMIFAAISAAKSLQAIGAGVRLAQAARATSNVDLATIGRTTMAALAGEGGDDVVRATVGEFGGMMLPELPWVLPPSGHKHLPT
jgi:hypothetical protein